MIPIISVLLPVYNGEKFLKEAIDSVLGQSFTSFELLIIDDGSTDDSCNIVLGYNDSRIRFLRNQKNIGLIKTLNKGLEIAKGNYLARIDADDYMHPTRLEQQVRFLDAHNDYVLVGSSVQLVRDGIEIEGDILKYYSDHDDIVFSMSFYCPFIHPSIMLRMGIVREYQLKFDSGYLHAEDYEFWTRLVRFGKVYNLDENLTYYRVHFNQISNVHLDLQKKQMKKIQVKFLNENLLNFSDEEKLCLFSTENNYASSVFYQAIAKLSENLFFTGAVKERYLLKKVKNHMLEKNSFKLVEWSYILKNPFFYKANFSFVQYLSFIIKTLKFKK